MLGSNEGKYSAGEHCKYVFIRCYSDSPDLENLLIPNVSMNIVTVRPIFVDYFIPRDNCCDICGNNEIRFASYNHEKYEWDVPPGRE